MTEKENELFRMLRESIKNVYAENPSLLQLNGKKRKGLEQAFVFRTGVHLNGLIEKSDYKSFNLDAEYNKNGTDSKKTNRFPKGIRPDLILHQRGTNDNNKIAVEFKGFWSKGKAKKDRKKLEDLTAQAGDYCYLLGVLVLIGQDKPDFEIYKNGEKCAYEELE